MFFLELGYISTIWLIPLVSISYHGVPTVSTSCHSGTPLVCIMMSSCAKSSVADNGQFVLSSLVNIPRICRIPPSRVKVLFGSIVTTAGKLGPAPIETPVIDSIAILLMEYSQ